MPAKRASRLKAARKVPTGPPSTYTQAAADLLCDRIATSRKSIRAICAEEDGLPSPDTVRRWMLANEPFQAQYARAKSLQMEMLEDEILEISDESSHDTIMREDGGEQPDSEWIARSKLRVDTRKWLMSKLSPKKYGDKLDLNQSGTLNVVTTHMTRAEFKKRVTAAKENRDRKKGA